MEEPKFKTGQVWVHDELGKFIVLEHSFRKDRWIFRCQGIEGGYDGCSPKDWFETAFGSRLDESSTVEIILSKYE